jgi:hypothetical protein
MQGRQVDLPTMCLGFVRRSRKPWQRQQPLLQPMKDYLHQLMVTLYRRAQTNDFPLLEAISTVFDHRDD